MKKQTQKQFRTPIQQGFGAVGVILILVVIGIIGFAGYVVSQQKTGDDNGVSITPPTPTATQKVKHLCYLKDNKAQCYNDTTYKTVSPAKAIDDLRVVKIAPSPKDDKLALLTQATDNADMEMYVTDSALKTTKVELKDYTKNSDSIAWLPDQSGLVFEANPVSDKSKRILVRYTFADKQFKELTKSDTLSMQPIITDSAIVFQRFDMAANPVSAWQWHKMNLDGTNDTDLGLNAGFGGVIVDGKLIDTKADGTTVSLDLSTKAQTPLSVKLTTLTTTGSGITSLEDGTVVYPYQSTPSADKPNDRLALVNITTGDITNLTNTGAGSPFQTSLFN